MNTLENTSSVTAKEIDMQKIGKTIFSAMHRGQQLVSDTAALKHFKEEPSVQQFVRTISSDITTLITRIFEARSVTINLKDLNCDTQFNLIQEGCDVLMDNLNTDLDEAEGLRLKISNNDVLDNMSSNLLAQTDTSNNSSPARRIEKPQNHYATKIDNSKEPFIPFLKRKPHSLKPLSMILSVSSTGTEFYPHPYMYELQHWSVPEHQLTQVNPTKPLDFDTTPFTMVAKMETLKEMINELLQFSEIAIDLEAHTHRSYQGLTCLMQISTREKDYIVDTIAFKKKSNTALLELNEVFANPKILKVFHGADSDILWLQRDLGLYVVNMFDTHQAAVALSYPTRSLAYLLTTHCDVVTCKEYQKEDWRQRPLPAGFVKYARMDTHYLLYIYEVMRNELLDRSEDDNLLHTVYDRSTGLCESRYEKPILFPDSHMKMYKKSRKYFNSRQLYALKQLFAWRDDVARREDESTEFILPNRMILKLADALPKDVQGVLACCNPIPILVRQEALLLHHIMLDAIKMPIEEVETNLAEAPVTNNHKKNADIAMLTCKHDFSQVDKTRTHLPTLFDSLGSLSLTEETPVSAEQKPSSDFFFMTKFQKDLNSFEWVSKYMTIYQRYIEYLEIKPLLEEARKSKDQSSVQDRIKNVLDYVQRMTSETKDESEESEDDIVEVKEELNDSVEIIKPTPKKHLERLTLKQRKQLSNPNNRHKDQIHTKRKLESPSDGSKKAKLEKEQPSCLEAFDYSNQDMSIFTHKKLTKKEKKPMLVVEEKFKGISCTKSTGSRKSGQKSFSFGMKK